jgi:hypothetical protein
MSRNFDNRLEKLERTQGIRPGISRVEEMTEAELIWVLRQQGIHITADITGAELTALIDAEIARRSQSTVQEK